MEPSALKVTKCGFKPPCHCWHEIHHSIGVGTDPEDIAHYCSVKHIPLSGEVYINPAGSVLIPMDEAQTTEGGIAS